MNLIQLGCERVRAPEKILSIEKFRYMGGVGWNGKRRAGKEKRKNSFKKKDIYIIKKIIKPYYMHTERIILNLQPHGILSDSL